MAAPVVLRMAGNRRRRPWRNAGRCVQRGKLLHKTGDEGGSNGGYWFTTGAGICTG